MNFMEQVAKFFDLKLGEEFYIVEYEELSKYTFEFTENGIWANTKHDNAHIYDIMNKDVLLKLLTGKISLVKKAWKPNKDEVYHYILLDGTQAKAKWSGDTMDIHLYLSGNCFKTAKEANDNVDNYKKYMEEKNPETLWRLKA